MSETTNEQEKITNNKLFDALLDFKSKLSKNTASARKVTNTLEEIKI